ncbi:MAG TPA: DNA-3-methyladenine glycosylase [Candidatus Dormibacteraeota bacterium]|nr:DNA-3-methyladenine glycosylase [Candidatus Dormibacteraeota bacterium]
MSTRQATIEENMMSQLRILDAEFYARDTVKVAPGLVGKWLVRIVGGERLIGRIVEVEAYRGKDDPASHAYRGRTPRNAPMYGEPGHAYIYFTYGNHYCLNITTQPTGIPGAVLLRAIQPLEGLGTMRRLRPNVPDTELTNGPGKLTKALNIDKSLNEQSMTVKGPLFVAEPQSQLVQADYEIWRSTRIGVTEALDKRWRFFLKLNPYVSKRRGLREAKFSSSTY